MLLITASLATKREFEFVQRDALSTATHAAVKTRNGLAYSEPFEYAFRSLTLVAAQDSEFRPVSWQARLLSLTQNIAGPGQLALFLLAIRRKFRR
jgi:hypothetical protein